MLVFVIIIMQEEKLWQITYTLRISLQHYIKIELLGPTYLVFHKTKKCSQ